MLRCETSETLMMILLINFPKIISTRLKDLRGYRDPYNPRKHIEKKNRAREIKFFQKKTNDSPELLV